MSYNWSKDSVQKFVILGVTVSEREREREVGLVTMGTTCSPRWTTTQLAGMFRNLWFGVVLLF